MSQTISFVASDELADFLEREAEKRMTTVSSTAQMLLAEKVREMDGSDMGADPGKSGSAESETPDPLDSATQYEFGTKAAADAVRSEFSEYLGEGDDKRFTRVEFAEGTPGEIVAELERRAE